MAIGVTTAATIDDIGLTGGRVFRVGDRAIIISDNKIAAINDDGVIFQVQEFEPAPGGYGGIDPYFVHDNGDGTMNIYFRLSGPSLPVQHSDVYITLNADTGAKIGATKDLPFSTFGSYANLGQTDASGKATGQMLQQAVSLSDGTIAVVDTTTLFNKFALKIVNPDGTGISLSASLGNGVFSHDSQLLFDLTEVGDMIAVAWTETTPGTTGSPAHVRLVNKDGSFASAQIDLGNSSSLPIGVFPAVQIETMTDGRLLVVWTENATTSGPDTDQSSTWFQILNADGTSSTGATLVNTEITTARQDTPLVIITESGFVIGYSVLDFAGIQEGRLKEFAADGTLLDTQTGAYIWASNDIIRTDNNSAFIVGGNIYEISLTGADTPLDGGGTGGGGQTLTGTGGKDILKGGVDGDTLIGKGGNDKLSGGGGDDFLFGDRGADRLNGNKGADTLKGGNGNDQLLGGKGNDKLFGGKGADILDGGTGKDALTGGGGKDNFVFKSGYGKDKIKDFTDNVDTIQLDAALWSGTLTKQQVITQFASVVNGTDILFDFGTDKLTLVGFSDLAALKNDLLII